MRDPACCTIMADTPMSVLRGCMSALVLEPTNHRGRHLHMKDSYISRMAVITAVLWATALLMVLATWLLGAIATHQWQAGTGVTAVLFMALAVTCQTRLYTLRVCGLIRVSAGLSAPDAELVHIGSGGQRPG